MSNVLNTITKDGVTYASDVYTEANKKVSSDPNTLGKDAFLQLLVTQMQYQDPLDPQDNSEYLAQLAQFSALEQMTNVAEAVESLSTIVKNLDTTALVGQLSNMIGKEVQWTTNATVTDSDGNAVLDADGDILKRNTSFTGTVKGVSISDGNPTLAVESEGKMYSVSVSDVTGIGEFSTASTAGATTSTQ